MRVGVIVTQRVLARSVYTGRVIALDARGWCLGVVDDAPGDAPWLCTPWYTEASESEVQLPQQRGED